MTYAPRHLVTYLRCFGCDTVLKADGHLSLEEEVKVAHKYKWSWDGKKYVCPVCRAKGV